MPKRVSSLRRRLAILVVVSFALSGALAAPSVLALWGEPGVGVTAPGGTLAPPITTGPLPQTRTGALTVSQGTLSGYGRSTFLGAGDAGGVTAVGEPYQQGTSIVNLLGRASAVVGGVGREIGLYGLARTNQGATVAVAGFNGGYSNAYAGFLYGPVSITGNLGVGVDTIGSMTIGGSLIVRGLTVPTAPGTITAEATSATGKSAVAATQEFNAVYNPSSLAAATGELSAGTCPAGQRCAGVYGSDGSAAVDIAGRWAGYFNGDVNVQGTVYLNGTPLPPVSAKTVSPPQFQNIPSMTLVSSQTFMSGGAFGFTGDSSLGFDGDFLWIGNDHYDILANKNFNYIIKMEPVTMTGVAVCRMAFGDATTAVRFAFDGQNLWVNSWDGNSGSPPPVATNRLIRIPIGSMVLADDISRASNCGGTQVSAATYQPYLKSAPFADGTTVWYSAYQNGSGHYLVELDPRSLAVRSATPVGDTVAQTSNEFFNPDFEPKADATYVWVPVVVGGDSKLARVTKSDKSVLVKDYSSADCPASNLTCLPDPLVGAVSYSAVGVGGGFVWAAALEGADDASSRQRLLKIDPATGNLLDAFPGGYGGGVLFDGAYVWTSTKTYGGGPAAVLYRLGVSDSSIATKDGVTLGTESTFDQSYIYASSGGGFVSKILR